MTHEGETAAQRRAGFTGSGWGSAGVKAAVPAVAAEFLARQRLLVIAAADAAGAVWASPLAGPPGFAAAPDERTVTVDRLPGPGDPLAGRFDTERDIGMLALEPGTRRRMRVNGRARRDGSGLVVRTEQVYANCPKYIQTRTPTDEPAPAGTGAATRSERPDDGQLRWIAGADTFFVATRAPGHGADASHRGGSPGFVRVTGAGRLTWPDYVGNAMFMTLGNLELDPRCGLLFLDWEGGRALHLTGRARVDWDPERAAAVPGAQRLVDFDVEQVVEVAGAVPQRWAFEAYSRFNPPVTT
ncbi:pyridoxamine 5'-phosphate oxidase family protein [Nonomuraea sp. NPDC047897]|jgi:predicted pyridoxine 5'-phosphate oxidase superfamily flavin-nucleotide-binding protein|uniref:pyridoxamine 5'-phosphate oxidase family protein n=1 Tax=Nonomuraea sp. NPDC047897 TaxID=3364346 RepID=UPI003716E878